MEFRGKIEKTMEINPISGNISTKIGKEQQLYFCNPITGHISKISKKIGKNCNICISFLIEFIGSRDVRRMDVRQRTGVLRYGTSQGTDHCLQRGKT